MCSQPTTTRNERKTVRRTQFYARSLFITGPVVVPLSVPRPFSIVLRRFNYIRASTTGYSVSKHCFENIITFRSWRTADAALSSVRRADLPNERPFRRCGGPPTTRRLSRCRWSCLISTRFRGCTAQAAAVVCTSVFFLLVFLVLGEYARTLLCVRVRACVRDRPLGNGHENPSFLAIESGRIRP